MGVGDWIMATGEAKKHWVDTGRRVAFIDWKGRHHWHEVFENNPTIVRPDELSGATGYDVLRQGGGERPYIEKKLSRMWVWKPYKPEPGQLFLSPEEIEWGGQHAGEVIIEPFGKRIGHRNKQWGDAKWANVVRELLRSGIEPCHMGPAGTPAMPGARFIKTTTFRHAAAVMRSA